MSSSPKRQEMGSWEAGKRLPKTPAADDDGLLSRNCALLSMNHGLVSMSYGSLWGIVYSGLLLGLPARG